MSWVTTWVADPLGLLLAVVLTGGYAAGVLAARRRGTTWPWGRTAVYAVLGVGSLVLATCGALAAYRGTLFWVGAAQATVLSAVTPLGLALGDPLGLARAAWPPLGRGVGPGLTRLGRVAMFPLVSSVVAAGVLVVLFFTPWFASSLTTAVGPRAAVRRAAPDRHAGRAAAAEHRAAACPGAPTRCGPSWRSWTV